jgi:hypothetical protein
VDFDVKTNIGRDEQNVDYDVSNLQTAISTVRQDISNLQTDVKAIANEGPAPPGDISTFVVSADSQIQQAIARPTPKSTRRTPMSRTPTAPLIRWPPANARATGQEARPPRSATSARNGCYRSPARSLADWAVANAEAFD